MDTCFPQCDLWIVLSESYEVMQKGFKDQAVFLSVERKDQLSRSSEEAKVFEWSGPGSCRAGDRVPEAASSGTAEYYRWSYQGESTKSSYRSFDRKLIHIMLESHVV